MPLLKDTQQAWNHITVTSWMGNNYALQNERYRYIIYEDGSEELYDHHSDPNEWHNIASNPELHVIKQEMKRALPEKRFTDEVIKKK